MYRNRNDPRLRRTLDHISQNLESANESAQANIYSFSHNYIQPCFSSVGGCFQACVAPCARSREDRLRRQRRRGRGRAELNFDFYDDWDEDENDEFLGWGNNEFDRLLAGSGSQPTSHQPGRQRAMSYGARRGERRKSAVQPHDGGPDPTIIPTSSYFGFLGRLPWKIGGKGLRYRPSAADLQEHPGAGRRSLEEQPLIEESDEEASPKRHRSETTASGRTTDSMSSRGDIFPSEDEIDDAVPLDDEFAMVLERRNTGMFHDDNSSGKTPHDKRPFGSRMSTRTPSSKSADSRRRSDMASPTVDKRSEAGIHEIPTMVDLRYEEERLQREEEEVVERKRDAARVLAAKRGLRPDSPSPSPLSETKSAPVTPVHPVPRQQTPERPSSPGTIPFPSFDAPPTEMTFAAPDYIKPRQRDRQDTAQTQDAPDTSFVPAKLPHFKPGPE
ncbi:uncharacterized protein K452DRAFT_351141 [Aplosporella prunicola CBS 121167]|uniref:Uncharacterized protein n=1 Tax=Aplosporella prunicola CBS 121167 TaxID=1176127 RepID=A0A6A6BDI3_9PEZI|nr:uncharacterized protein K452DRAFT_351141 [Aplosporella prunicola CBS 121167]KAF2142230.1 hypothetical protein K452DRAFT_351141 [Aplosporella prunicola CBS 121167]